MYNFIFKITTSCPGNCTCCKNRQNNFKAKAQGKYFDLRTFETICEQIKKIGGKYICLSGGEPTLVHNLDEYISIAHSFDLVTRINTNGWNVTFENLKKWTFYGLDQIVLSIYGLNEESVKKARGREDIYKKSIEAAKTICEFKNENKLVFIIQTVLMRDVYLELPQILSFAIDVKADRFWPSYLEDAFNLDEIRMREEDVLYFKQVIAPEMKNIINFQQDFSIEKKQELCTTIDSYFSNDYSNGIYHLGTIKCPWIGKHFTFYPNGTIDPCPGHEYFNSEQQLHIDYTNINKYLNEEYLNLMSKKTFDYCKYCPHGEHIGLVLSNKTLDEHCSKEEL